MHAVYGALYPVYVRALALLAAHRPAEAAAELQKINDHRGVVVSDPVGALARYQHARAYALAGDRNRASAGYRDVLTSWKDADPDVPLVKQARAESAALR